MSTPSGPSNTGHANGRQPAPPLQSTTHAQGQNTSPDVPHQTMPSRSNTLETSTNTFATASDAGDQSKPKKKRHRAGKKRRNRRQSFVAPSEDAAEDVTDPMERPTLLDTGVGRTISEQERERDSFYRLGGARRSSESVDSEALLDHRLVPNLSLILIQIF
jgi:magnesium transporter